MNAVLNILSGDQSFFGGPKLSPEDAAHARGDQISSICRYTRGMMVVNILSAIVFVAGELPSADAEWAMAWGFAIVVFASYHYLKATRPRTPVTQTSERTVRRAVGSAFKLGALWALLPLVFFPSASQPVQLIIICLCTGLVCGGAFVLGSIPIAAICFMMPIIGGMAYAFLGRSDPLYALVALLMFLYFFVLIRAVVSHGQEMLERMVGKYAAQREAREDSLTRLPNRVAITAGIDDALAKLRRFGDEFAVFYLDLDGFKEVNDALGHFAGDQVLTQVAERLSSCARATDLVGRIGGDEFAIICPGIATPQAATNFAERIIKGLSASFIVDGTRMNVGTSIGIALAPSNGREPQTLLRNADDALYRAKRGGRGSYCFFQESDNEKVSIRRNLERELRSSLGTNSIYLDFQPFLNLSSGELTGFEALVRWKHPDLGLVGPNVFIPIAEEAGLMTELGEQILVNACREAATWPEHLRLAVNFSVLQFRSESITQTILDNLRQSGLAPARLEIEITESVFLAKAERAVHVLEDLSALGVRISLDDFGTGFSSLTSLRKLPLGRVKVDRSFVMDVAQDKECAVIVKAIIDLARAMDIRVTAEGIETPEQLAFLREIGCEEVQGYLISKPIPAGDARELAHRPAALDRPALLVVAA